MAEKDKIKHYCPSSGSEQMWFEDKFCEICSKMGKDGKPPHCKIWGDMMVGVQRHEWCYVNGIPECITFQSHLDKIKESTKKRDDKLIKSGQTYF